MAPKWEEIAARKQAQREALSPSEWRLHELPSSNIKCVLDIPQTCGILSQMELNITQNYDATDLISAIRARKLKCVDVTRAFCKRAAIAQQLTNCLTEIMFEAALDRAKWLDAYFEEHGKPVGPLHGLPVSVKDSFRIKGVDSSIGLAAFCFKPSVTDSPLVTILERAGAVIHCKTNVPQTLMTLDTVNNIFGRTLNPWNRDLTVGGSSGGEGALVALRGSLLGVGTDVGGSIRIPAACNGLYGFKPSANRVPYMDQEHGGMPGMSKLGIESCAGPITSSMRDCELFMQVVIASEPWRHDPAVMPCTWTEHRPVSPPTPRNLSSSEIFTFGILTTDGITQPLPPISRLLTEVRTALVNRGHKVRSITKVPRSLRTAQSLANALFNLEGSNTMLDHIQAFDEPLVAWLQPRLLRKSPSALARAAELQARRDQLMTDMLDIWQDDDSCELDAILCPVAPHPIPQLDRWNAIGYTSMWNLLDYPAGVVPVRQVKQCDLNDEMPADRPLGSWDQRNRELWDTKTVSRKIYLGSPLAIQVVAPRLQEYRLCQAMETVDRACAKHIDGRGAQVISDTLKTARSTSRISRL